MSEIKFFTNYATAKGIRDFINAKRKSRQVFQELGYQDKVSEKTREIAIAANQMWELHRVEYFEMGHVV